MQQNLKVLPKWRNFAKSGHTATYLPTYYNLQLSNLDEFWRKLGGTTVLRLN